MTITLTHKIAAPMWSKMAAPMWTQDGHYKMACRRGQLWPVGGDQDSRGGHLGGTRSAREGNWGLSGLQGRAVGGGPGLQGRKVRDEHTCRGEQLGAIRLAGEQLGINHAGRAGVRG